MSENDGAELLVALRHPLRRQILRAMIDKVPTSPREVAEALGEPLSNVSYHVRVLAECEAIKMVDIQPVRGSLAHFYEIDFQEPWAMAALMADGGSSPEEQGSETRPGDPVS